ncbi:transposase, partial [Treponema endosymbiont of Eucomonympha sp.]|uniref:transposase n=1 Tax=Treponema endosymbiont of Eucomonympha sp. TaxID=1580831 RepID=UPI0027D2739F
MVVDEYGIPASGIVTSGTVADCSQAPLLMEDLGAEAFLADKAYDTNELLDMLKEADIAAVIPPVKSRKEQRAYNHELYRARHVQQVQFVGEPVGGYRKNPRIRRDYLVAAECRRVAVKRSFH